MNTARCWRGWRTMRWTPRWPRTRRRPPAAEAAISQAESQIVESEASQGGPGGRGFRPNPPACRSRRRVARNLRHARGGAANYRIARRSRPQCAARRPRRPGLGTGAAPGNDGAADRPELRAPAAGVVSRRTARLGAVITMAAEPLFRLIADGAIELEGEVYRNRADGAAPEPAGQRIRCRRRGRPAWPCPTGGARNCQGNPARPRRSRNRR